MKLSGPNAACASVLLILVGCEAVENVYYHEPEPAEPVDIRIGTTDPAILGTWVLDKGYVLPGLELDVEVTAFEFPEDGRGHVFVRDRLLGAVNRLRAFCVYDGSQMVLDLAREPQLVADAGRAGVFPMVIIERDELTIADEAGNVALLSRHNVIPPELDTPPLPVVRRFDGLPEPEAIEDVLVFFDGDLLYPSRGNRIERFDLETETLLDPIPGMEPTYIMAVQNAPAPQSFWLRLRAGAATRGSRSDLVSTFDEFDLADLGFPMAILGGGAWQEDAERLWLQGLRNERRFLLSLDTESEPDQIDRILPFDRGVLGLAYDGTHLWAAMFLATQILCQIDPSTGKVVATYDVPDDAVFWRGLTFGDDGRMYVLSGAPEAAMVLELDPEPQLP